MKKKKYSTWDKGFICGYVAAVVVTLQNHGMRSEVCCMWKCNKLSIEDMERAGVDAHDIEILKQHWDELNYEYRG